MNGFARVMISVALLGACAYGMKFTMKTVEVPELTPVPHKWSQKISENTKLLKVHYEGSGNITAVNIGMGAQNRVEAQYDANQADEFSGNILPLTNSKLKQDGTLEASIVSNAKSQSYFFGIPPVMPRTVKIHFPPNIPLDVENIHILGDLNANIDLRGLNIDRFSYLRNIMTDDVNMNQFMGMQFISLYLPPSKISTTYFVENQIGSTSVFIDPLSRGKINLKIDAGEINIHMLEGGSGLLHVYASEESPDFLMQRVELDDFFLNATPQKINTRKRIFSENFTKRFMIKGFQGNHQNDLELNIDLGAAGRLKFFKWDGKS